MRRGQGPAAFVKKHLGRQLLRYGLNPLDVAWVTELSPLQVMALLDEIEHDRELASETSKEQHAMRAQSRAQTSEETSRE